MPAFLPLVSYLATKKRTRSDEPYDDETPPTATTKTSPSRKRARSDPEDSGVPAAVASNRMNPGGGGGDHDDEDDDNGPAAAAARPEVPDAVASNRMNPGGGGVGDDEDEDDENGPAAAAAAAGPEVPDAVGSNWMNPGGDEDDDEDDDDNGPVAAAAARPEEERRRLLDDLAELVDRYADSRSLSAHTAAASAANRRRESRPYGPPTNADEEDDEMWTAEDTDRALEGLPFDERVGLRFYGSDPLPRIRRACRASGKRFLDHEFPTHRLSALSIPSSLELSSEHILGPRHGDRGGEAPAVIAADDDDADATWSFAAVPGVLTDSNCRDFFAGGRRHRVRSFARSVARRCRRPGGRAVGAAAPVVPIEPFAWEWTRCCSSSDDDDMPQQEGGVVLFGTNYDSDGDTSVHPRNVIQGRTVGNCGLCSGIASVAACAPQLLRGAFGSGSVDALRECGAVSLRLHPNNNGGRGRPRYLLMDDHVLSLRGARPGGDGDEIPPTMRGLAAEEVWMRLLEKAFAKIQGSFASLDGLYKYGSLYRHPGRAVQLLTGAPLALEVRHGTPADAGMSAKDHADLVYDILLLTQGRYARVAHCRSNANGLRRNHGYSLLWAGTVGGGVRLVCLRNPHGRESYRGPYGHGSAAWTGREVSWERVLEVPELQSSLPIPGLVRWLGDPDDGDGDGDGDNGVFLMELERFVRCVPIVTLVGPVPPCAPGTTERRRENDDDDDDYDSGGAPRGVMTEDRLHRILPRHLNRAKEIILAANRI